MRQMLEFADINIERLRRANDHAGARRRREDVAGAVRAAHDSQAEALNVFSSPVLSSLHREIIAFAAEYHLPAIYQWKEHC